MIILPLLFAINLFYPIPELGYCQSKTDCQAFCSFSVNQEACTNYGKKMGLIKEGAVLAQVTINYPVAELGNCASKQACKAYCNIPANYQACTSFAKSKGIINPPTPSPTPAKDPNSKSLSNLKFPIAELGNCSSAPDCKNYCDQPANRQVCFEFGRKQGLTGNQEAGSKLGGLQFPIAELGNCDSFTACEAYCDQPGNRQTCMNYAKAHGFEPPKDKRGPGGCTSDEECKKFCQANPTNEECAKGRDDYCKANPDKCQKGPGGCTTDEECKKYCKENPNDQDCVKGREKYCQQYPDKCVKETGPGGCKSDEECKKYCESNPDDGNCKKTHEEYCQKNPQDCQKQSGPGGCATEEECKKYCQQNPTDADCKKGQEDYCQKHPEDCQKKTGPIGCQSEEECKKYCEDPANKVECQKSIDEYCQKNPNDEKCQNRINEPPKDNGPKTGPGGCSSEEECKAYCSDPSHQAECQQPPQ